MKKLMRLMVAAIGLAALVAQGAEPKPLLVPDYNRDGKIDAVDFDRFVAGEAFTVWLNDDDDDDGTDGGAEAGDTNNDLHDVPGGNDDKDFADDKVNGRCDLLDFFPVLINVEVVEGWETMTWKLSSPSVNVVFTRLKEDTAGGFHTKETKALNDETPLYEAEVEQLAGEDGEEKAVELPAGFLENGRGVIIVEGAAIGEGLTLRGEKDGSDPVEVTLKLSVKNVEDMYGWLNLRPKVKDEGEGEQWKVENSTVRLPTTTTTDTRHFILVHGYNTNHEEARGNAAEFYKKLYQSGSDAMFTAVEWKGDQSQIKFEKLGVNFSPNYHVNVENAFAAARPFAEACKKLPGEKILVAHSLGNVLISSAIKDYGLDYTKYVMLNAAVPREAYDASAYDEDMVPETWLGGEGGGSGDDLTNHLDRAARWYRNFADHKYDPYEYRRKLAWRGRFANLPRTVNYYSQSDNILVNPAPNDPDPDKVFDPNDQDLYRKVEELLALKLVNGRSIGSGGSKKTGFGFWSFSEKMKGTWLLNVVNDVLTNMLEVAQADAYKCEGGWGENDDYEEKDVFDPANTRFTPFLDERLKTQGMLDILPAETERLRAQHLADAIPAESFAAGANSVTTLENVNEEDFIGENLDWPLFEGEEVHTNLWNHSAFREVAFYHTSKFYTSIAAVGKPRVIIDTDLGSSMDDLFTIDLAARMHKAGKLDLMAVMIDRPDKFNPEKDGEFLTFADRYLASLGLGDLPIGKAMMPADSQTSQYVFNPYWTLIYSNNVTGVGLLLPTNRTPDQVESLTNAVALYRRLLHDLPDGQKVVICSTGFLTNLKGLMESEENEGGDDIWSTGLELIEQKVKELRIMGGWFDMTTEPADGEHGAEYNFAGDPAAAKKVVEGWPTPVILSPWEEGLKLDYKTPNVLEDFPPGTFDPVVRAAHIYWPEPLGDDDKNRLWDPATILPLTEGEAFLPLSEVGGISVDGFGKTTFVPDPSSNRCYQVASKMNATAVMNRIRAICRTGNPSLPDAVRCIKDAGVDYNGHDLTFKVPKFSLGAYGPDDVRLAFAFGDRSYGPDEVTYDPVLEVFSVHFAVPEEDATAGNVYNGALTITLENDTIGTTVIKTVPTQLVQGRQEQAEPMTDWFNETNLEAPTNYVPATAMPERNLATVETTFLFEAPSEATEEPPATNWVQGAIRIVSDGADGYKFQYYACVGKTNEDSFVRGWWDFNVGGEEVSEIKPKIGTNYTVRAEAYYFDDTRGGENTLVISVDEEGSNRGMMKQFVGNIINRNGGQGGTTRLNSVEFTGGGEISSLVGNYYTNVVNATLAKIDGDREYATVAEAVAAAAGSPIRLLHAASWKPTEVDLDKPVKFLNKSCLVLDLSGLPANAMPVWTDVDGNDGTLTVKLVSADTVVYGKIRTAEKGNPLAGAIAIADGKYVYVGDEAGVAAFIEDGVTKVVDHRGKGMVMPGCTDGHSHYTLKFSLANIKGGVMFDLNDDKEKVLQKLETAALAAQKAGKTCLYGFGWNFLTLRFGGDQPTLKELDDATHGVSTVIFDQGGHHTFCNSECLKRCGIIDGNGKVLITEIDGGYLELDDKGYPTGYAEERVTGYLTRMGGINYDELVDDEVAEAALRASQKLLLSSGYTIALEGWSNTLHPSKFYEAAHRMDTNGTLKLVFPMTYEVEPWQTNMNEQIDYLDSLNKTYRTSHVLPEYLKIFMDGVVETKTGAMLKPYVDDKKIYPSFWSTNRLADITRECNGRGLTVHVHTMGDAAVRDTVEAYIQGGDGTHRNCLVHLRNVSTNGVNDFQRIADNNIACTAGFTWHVGTKDDAQMEAFLDKDYVYHAYPMKSFFDAGVRVSSHSDFPANEPSPQDPFGIMEVAVTGQRPDLPADEKCPSYDPDELVTVEQVFEALTLNGAWQLGLENERGSIKVGKWADFVLADQDVFTCATNDIHKTKVVSTWFEGEKVYPAPVMVALPTGVLGFSYVVSNLTAGAEAMIAPTETTAGGATYELSIGAKVGIYCVPAEGYVVTGTNPYVIDPVTAETTLEGVTLPAAVQPVSADTVVYGKIRTAEKGNPLAGAIAIADGKYVYVGDEAGVAAFIEDGVTKVVDHRGKGMVMPGCTDGHSHYLNTFAMNNMKGGILFDLGDNKAAVMQKLEKAAREAQKAGKTSLCGFGWNSQIILTNKLSLADLDEITFGVSAVIYDSSGHHAFCNSECLKRCGIIDGNGGVLIKEIDGGLLELKDGYPTGYVNERVTGYLTRMGGIDPDELIDDKVAEVAIRKSQELLLSTGYTSAMDAWSNNLHPSNLYVVANRMDVSGDLKFALSMTYEVEPWQTDEAISNEIKRLDSLRATYGTKHVRPEYLKVFMDGVVEARTGATIEPYNKDDKHPEEYYYQSFWSVDRLAEITKACNEKGLTVHTHTMGDAAIRDVTDAYAKANELREDNTQRNCMAHLRNVRKEDFQRMAKNNIACAAGLTWHATDTDFDKALKQFLKDEYVEHAYPLKSFLDAGVRASSHSDYPANKPSPQDPFGMMHVAVNGMVPDPGEKDYPFDTDELVTVEQAFQMLTLNGAWQLGLENERGSIAVGKWADFVLADQDVFECAKTEIGKTKVVSTWFEGEKVFEASVPVMPGEQIVRDTIEEASNVLKRAEFTPSAEVAAKLSEDSDALEAYRKMFKLDVVPFGESQWAVEAFLLPPDWTNVVESAQAATRQIPLADIAALPLGVPTNVTAKGCCVPGFYYSFYAGSTVTNVRAIVDDLGRNVLCGPDRDVKFSGVLKPSDKAGFFSIGVLEVPKVYEAGTDYPITGFVPVIPGHPRPRVN